MNNHLRQALASLHAETRESGKSEGAAAERARIVAWLRDQANPDRQTRKDQDRLIKTIYYAALADAIERGDHVRPEPAAQEGGDAAS